MFEWALFRYKKHNALDRIRCVDEWDFGRSVVFCKGNVELEDVIYLPWYMIMFVKQNEHPKEMIYKANTDSLNI